MKSAKELLCRPIDIENACSNGNVEFIQSITQSTKKWNRKNKDNRTYIDIAIFNEEWLTVKALLEKGCDPSSIKPPINTELQQVLSTVNIPSIQQTLTKVNETERRNIHNICYESAKNHLTTLNDVKGLVAKYGTITTLHNGLTVKEELLSYFCKGYCRKFEVSTGWNYKTKPITFNHDYEIIKYLLESGTNPNSGGTELFEESPLSGLSCYESFGHRSEKQLIDIIDLLLSMGANSSYGKYQPLFIWLTTSNDSNPSYSRIINYLYEKGARIDFDFLREKRWNDDTQLLELKFNLYGLKYLKQIGFEYNETDIQLLMKYCVEYACAETYKFLIEQPAFKTEMLTDKTIWKYRLPIHYVCGYGLCSDDKHNKTAKEMIDIMVKTQNISVESPDYEGNTPLYRAVSNQHLEVVKHLIVVHGATVTETIVQNAMDPNLTNSPNIKKEIYEFLLTKYVKLINGIVSLRECFDKMHKFQRGSIHRQDYGIMIQEIKNILPTIETTDYTEVFKILCIHGFYQSAQKFLPTECGKGLLINVCKNISNPPWLEDATEQYLNTIKLILSFAPNAINETDDEMKTPLHHLCENKNADTKHLQLLLDFGADVDATDKSGKIPYEYAVCHSFKYYGNDTMTNHFYEILEKNGSETC